MEWEEEVVLFQALSILLFVRKSLQRPKVGNCPLRKTASSLLLPWIGALGAWNGCAVTSHPPWWGCCGVWSLWDQPSPDSSADPQLPTTMLASVPRSAPLCSFISLCLEWQFPLPVPCSHPCLLKYYHPPWSLLPSHVLHGSCPVPKVWKWSLPCLTFSNALDVTKATATVCPGLVMSLLCWTNLGLPQEGVGAVGGQDQEDKYPSLWRVWADSSHGSSADWDQEHRGCCRSFWCWVHVEARMDMMTSHDPADDLSWLSLAQKSEVGSSSPHLQPHIAWGPDAACTVVCRSFSPPWGYSPPQSFCLLPWIQDFGSEIDLLVLWTLVSHLPA